MSQRLIMVALTLAGSLVLFHVIAFSLRHRCTRKLWKTLDYAYLSLGTLSLVGALVELRGHSLKPAIDVLQEKIWDTYSPYGRNLGLSDDWAYDMAVRMHGYYETHRSMGLSQQGRDADVKAIESNPHLTPGLIEKAKFRYFFDQVKFDALEDGAERILLRNELRMHLRSALEQTEPSEIESFLIFITPFVAAIAAAIRATLTTIEIREWYIVEQVRPRATTSHDGYFF